MFKLSAWNCSHAVFVVQVSRSWKNYLLIFYLTKFNYYGDCFKFKNGHGPLWLPNLTTYGTYQLLGF